MRPSIWVPLGPAAANGLVDVLTLEIANLMRVDSRLRIRD